MQLLSDAVTSLELLDEQGQAVSLGTLKPAVLVWMRHFGCIFCREQAAQLAAHLSEIEGKGSRLVFISSGSPHFAKAFREDQLAKWPSILILCDTQRKSYKALGFRRSFLSLLSPAVWRRAWKLMRAGKRPSLSPQGDPLQNGGAIVVDGSGAIRYRFVSDEAGHHPDPAVLLEALPVELMLF